MGFRIRTTQTLTLSATRPNSGDVAVNVGTKPIVLLVLLAAAGAHGVSRRTVRDILWEGFSDANASNSLRQSIFRLRRALGADAIGDVGGRLILQTPIRVDLLDAEHLLGQGRVAEALEALGGPIGPTLDVAGPALQGWIRELRARVEHRLLDALTQGWADAARSPAPNLFSPTLAKAGQVLGDAPQLLWLQLEVAATLADVGAFEQVAQRLSVLGERGAADSTPLDIARRTAQWRARLQTRRTEGASTHAQPIHAHALHALEAAWQDALAGRSSLACLIGDAGTGRSWLLRGLARRCLAGGGRVVALVALDSASGITSACLRDLTVALQGHRGAAGVHPDFAETIDRLLEGVLSPPGDAIPAVHDLLTAVAVEGPLLVSLDDAHHYDARVLARLLRRLREVPIPGLLVVPVLPTAAGVEESARIEIGRTDQAGIRTLLGAMARLPRADWVSPLIDAVHRASDGTPARAARLVVRLHETGHLRVVDDRWHLASALEEALSALRLTAA